MRLRSSYIVIVLLMPHASANNLILLESVRPFVEQTAAEIDQVPLDRRKVLDKSADFVVERLAKRREAPLTFICTHNSRRSHLSQVWAQIAADHYGLSGVSTYSGGTEATACNIRTVRALQRTGLQIEAANVSDNPLYQLLYAENRSPIEVFSKVYNDEGNPQEDYAAMMCCADVDEHCPVVFGSAARIPLHYDDPKASDGTPEESATYDARCAEIALEMFYLFSLVAEQLRS
ncbi:MAG: protein-tyrosine-phosphatase [Aeoliella sp.]